MFEQSLLLPSAPSKKAGALAVSLGVQTIAVGMLLLVPLLYTDRLPFAQLQLPTLLPSSPARELPKPTPHRRSVAKVWRRLMIPTTIPPLNKVVDIIEDEPVSQVGIDSAAIMPPLPSMIMIQVIPPPPQVNEPSPPTKPITVTSDIQSAKLIRKVLPIYPRLAIAARISGTVRLIGTVGKDGVVQQIQIVSGPPLLVQAALDAVRQ